jgi:hypothetical protein
LLRKKKRREERLKEIIDWMESAEANALLIRERIKDAGRKEVVGRHPPLGRWRTFIAELTTPS